MKIQIHTLNNNLAKLNEILIYDSKADEYRHISRSIKPDVVWCLSIEDWKSLGIDTLKIHKIVFSMYISDKYEFSRKEFLFRDNFAAAYHVVDEETKELIEKLSFKPVYLIPYEEDNIDTFDRTVIENFKTSKTFHKKIMDIFKELKE